MQIKSFRSRVAAVAAVAAFAMGGFVTTPTTQAGPAIGNCAANNYCLYAAANYLQGQVPSTISIPDLRVQGFNDVTSSIRNARSFRVFYWDSLTYTVTSICTSAGFVFSTLQGFFNDVITSASTGNTYTTCP